MNQRHRSLILVGLLATSLVTGVGNARPVRPGLELNGLTENESSTLWSRDVDTDSHHEAVRQPDGGTRTVVSQIAAGTDITFKRPPATAATWTRNDFADLEAGDSNMSIHPSHASLEDGVFIEDAHATVFAVQPSTRGHLESGATPLYIAPNGTIRGFVDYRVRVPDGSSSRNRTVEWSLTIHEIEEIRLRKDEETIATTNGSHTPAIEYQIDDGGSAILTLEADIYVRLQKTVRTDVANGTDVDVSYSEETRTVSDSTAVEVYDLSVHRYFATYPNGDAGVAIFQSRPWHGYTLTDEGNANVRGVWRFYTARDTSWDTLVKSNQTGSSEVDSDAHPVYVHAYPSRIGPRAEPVRGGPEIIDTWGTDRTSPRDTIGENVTVGVVNQSYTATYGIAVRAATVDRSALDVTGIVRGVNASVVKPDGGSDRRLRPSNLTVEVLQQTQSQATLRLELHDVQTGTPIALTESDRRLRIGGRSRTGFITIADQKVETNASGVAIVTITRPGIYTARYRPGSWLGHDPAYVRDTATVRWHPLGTVDGWFAVFFQVGWQLLPFVVVVYVGHRLRQMLGREHIFRRKS